jgi:Transposase, Mutator family
MSAAYPWCSLAHDTTIPQRGGKTRHMAQATAHQTESKAPGAPLSGLDEALREGARRMLQQAVEAEIAEYIEAHSGALDDQGHRLVVRNGHTPERTIQTGLGDIPVRRPRVDDRRVDAEGPGQGPGAATGLLRLPCRALAAPAHHQPDRVHVCHGPPADHPDQGRRLPFGLHDHGLQTRSSRRAQVAENQWPRPPWRRHSRGAIQGRLQGRRVTSQDFSSTALDHISLTLANCSRAVCIGTSTGSSRSCWKRSETPPEAPLWTTAGFESESPRMRNGTP